MPGRRGTARVAFEQECIRLCDAWRRPFMAGLAVVIMSLAACSASKPSSDEEVKSSPSSDAAQAATGPTVGPGEAWIAYQWGSVDGSDGIFLVRPDGAGNHQLMADMPGVEWHPDWSPDGERLAFIHVTPSDQTELWVVDVDGRGAEMLIRCDLPCNTLGYPDWSPDGESIYVGVDADPTENGPPTTFGVDRYDLTSSQVQPVLRRTGDVTAEQPRISPDGTQLAYTRLRERPGKPLEGAIFVADTQGGPERRLTDWSMVAMHPDWTADGRIVFDTYDIMVFGDDDPPSPGNLWIMNADGSQQTQLTHFEQVESQASQPRVAPDGSGVSFTRDDGLQRRMAFLEFGDPSPHWLSDPSMSGTHTQLRPR